MRASAPRRLVVSVGAADAGCTVAALVGRIVREAGSAEKGAAAVGRGAVFVGRRRVTDPAERLPAGVTVQVTLAGDDPTLVVLVEDDDVVVLSKPAGISSTPDLSDRAGSLLGLLERRFGEGLHLLGRLDRDVTGVVVALRTERARARAMSLRREGRVERVYQAIVSPAPTWDERVTDVPIGRHPRDAKRRAPDGADAEAATTRLRRQELLAAGTALVEARPVTGRMHQIRVHLAHEGCPVVGDRAYGGARRLVLPSGEILDAPRVFLHAARLSMPHPGGRGTLSVEAPAPEDFKELLAALSSRP